MVRVRVIDQRSDGAPLVVIHKPKPVKPADEPNGWLRCNKLEAGNCAES